MYTSFGIFTPAKEFAVQIAPLLSGIEGKYFLGPASQRPNETRTDFSFE